MTYKRHYSEGDLPIANRTMSSRTCVFVHAGDPGLERVKDHKTNVIEERSLVVSRPKDRQSVFLECYAGLRIQSKSMRSRND